MIKQLSRIVITIITMSYRSAISSLCLPRLKNRSTTTNSTGIRKMPTNVLKVIPPTTALPMDTREPAPGPVAIARGRQPRINANEVIRIGRRRRWAALMAAVTTSCPPSRFILAYSTIRMAFLAASPISMIMATCI